MAPEILFQKYLIVWPSIWPSTVCAGAAGLPVAATQGVSVFGKTVVLMLPVCKRAVNPVSSC